jgi:hypothetical protein
MTGVKGDIFLFFNLHSWDVRWSLSLYSLFYPSQYDSGTTHIHFH